MFFSLRWKLQDKENYFYRFILKFKIVVTIRPTKIHSTSILVLVPEKILFNIRQDLPLSEDKQK